MPNSTKKTRDDGGGGESTMTDYEKERILRIKQNMERMKALGLPRMAASFNAEFCDKDMKGNSKACRKTTKDKDDGEDEYQPTSEEEEEEEEEDDDDDEEENNRRAKKKQVLSSSKKTRARTSKCPLRLRDEEVGNDDEIDENAALQKAIALSLGVVAEPASGMGCRETKPGISERKNLQTGTGKIKGRKFKSSSRPKMSEDDVISYFFLIDEAGKGNITSRDIKKAMVAHDFHWTDKEINDMICIFDSNGNGKLNLEDFRRIMVRCSMIQQADYD